MPGEIDQDLGIARGVSLIHDSNALVGPTLKKGQQRTHQRIHQTGERFLRQAFPQKCDRPLLVTQGCPSGRVQVVRGATAIGFDGTALLAGEKPRVRDTSLDGRIQHCSLPVRFERTV